MTSDDQGYADLGCYGSPNILTPRLDRMAAEGTRFTDFYAGASICSPSRACFLTGCYGDRVGIYQSIPSGNSMNPDEYTIAEILKTKGYATRIIGKRHLGSQFNTGLSEYGFDGWSPETADATRSDSCATATVNFINSHTTTPFFVWVCFTAPHVVLYEGNYKNSVEAMDTAVGRTLDAVDTAGISQNTFVVFHSDNGAWLDPCGDMAVDPCTPDYEGGSNAPLRSGKFWSYEGGHRIPCIMRWPGTIPAARVCREMLCGIDFYPTFANLVDGEIPCQLRFASGTVKPWITDGKDIMPVIRGEAGATTPHDVLYFYQLWQSGNGSSNYLAGLRVGDWKLHPVRRELFDLSSDIGETTNLYSTRSDIVAQLSPLFGAQLADMRDNRRPIYLDSAVPERYVPEFTCVTASRSRYRPARALVPPGAGRQRYDLLGRRRSGQGMGLTVSRSGAVHATVR